MLQLKHSEKRNRTYVRVSEGSLIVKEGIDRVCFDSISGAVLGVELRDHNVDGKKFKCWHLLMADTSTGQEYDVSFGRGSGTFHNILRCLASERGLAGLSDITIDVYKAGRGNFTNAVVYAGKEKLSWIPGQLPPVVYVAVGERNIPDDTMRTEWLLHLAEMVNGCASSRAIRHSQRN